MSKTKKKRIKKYQAPKPVYHYTESYLMDPQHPVTINLVGCGGTGSQVLTNLARIHTSLRALGHPGFHITAWDGDSITEANIGRQLFSRADIGLNKATVLISRLNRFYGLGWNSSGKNFQNPKINEHANITISCVDTVKARRMIWSKIQQQVKRLRTPPRNLTMQYLPDQPEIPMYWLDFGNSNMTGQVILGTCQFINGNGKKQILANIFDLFPKMEKHEKRSGPSCSLAEALDKQDLFINSTLAQFGCDLIWKMFREARIQYHGLFLNLETMITTPLKVTA